MVHRFLPVFFYFSDYPLLLRVNTKKKQNRVLLFSQFPGTHVVYGKPSQE